MGIQKHKEIHPEKNPVIRLFQRFMAITDQFENGKFFVKKRGHHVATPLFIALLVVETTDVIFAIDSIPAILAVTSDPFIVYTSNVFAILGLRALYFAISEMMRHFQYLHYGLSAILVFVGAKMLLSDICKIPVVFALGMVADYSFDQRGRVYYRSEKSKVLQRRIAWRRKETLNFDRKGQWGTKLITSSEFPFCQSPSPVSK